MLQGLRSSSRDGSGGVRVVRLIVNHWTASTVPGLWELCIFLRRGAGARLRGAVLVVLLSTARRG